MRFCNTHNARILVVAIGATTKQYNTPFGRINDKDDDVNEFFTPAVGSDNISVANISWFSKQRIHPTKAQCND